MSSYSRSDSIGTTTISPEKESVSLSSVIVSSLNNLKESLDEEDPKSISTAITEGINNSVLIKQESERTQQLQKVLTSESNNTAKRIDELQKLLVSEKQDNTDERQQLLESQKQSESLDKLAELLKKQTDDKESEDRKQSKADQKEKKDGENMTKLLAATGSSASILATIGAYIAKAAIITVAISQILVLLKAGFAAIAVQFEKLPYVFDKGIISIMAGIQTLPDYIGIAVRSILPHGFFDKYLTSEEKKERDALKDELSDVLGMERLAKGPEEARKALLSGGDPRMRDYLVNNEDVDLSGLDVSTEEGKEKLKDLYRKAYEYTMQFEPSESREGSLEELQQHLDMLDKLGSPETLEKLARFEYLQGSGKEHALAQVQNKYRQNVEDAMTEKTREQIALGENASWRVSDIKDSIAHYVKTDQKQELEEQISSPTYRGRPMSNAERFLTHEFKDWMQSWKDLGTHLAQNTGVNVRIKSDKSNPLKE